VKTNEAFKTLQHIIATPKPSGKADDASSKSDAADEVERRVKIERNRLKDEQQTSPKGRTPRKRKEIRTLG